MNSIELREQTVELLPGREALGRFKLTVAKVYASNTSVAANLGSWCSSANSGAVQTIVIG